MSTPYGAPSGGYGQSGNGQGGYPSPPPAPPRKNRAPLFIALSCGCALLVAIVVLVAGAGLFVIGQDAEEPTRAPITTSSEEPASEDPATEAPTTGIPTSEPPSTDLDTDRPAENPTEPPESDAVSDSASSISVQIGPTSEDTTLETHDDVLESQNGKFVGVEVTITNNGTSDIGLSGENFRFYDEDGQSYTLRYGAFSTSGPQIAPGEEAVAELYADVPGDATLDRVSYTDEVGTGGQEVSFPVG